VGAGGRDRVRRKRIYAVNRSLSLRTRGAVVGEARVAGRDRVLLLHAEIHWDPPATPAAVLITSVYVAAAAEVNRHVDRPNPASARRLIQDAPLAHPASSRPDRGAFVQGRVGSPRRAVVGRRGPAAATLRGRRTYKIQAGAICRRFSTGASSRMAPNRSTTSPLQSRSASRPAVWRLRGLGIRIPSRSLADHRLAPRSSTRRPLPKRVLAAIRPAARGQVGADCTAESIARSQSRGESFFLRLADTLVRLKFPPSAPRPYTRCCVRGFFAAASRFILHAASFYRLQCF